MVEARGIRTEYSFDIIIIIIIIITVTTPGRLKELKDL